MVSAALLLCLLGVLGVAGSQSVASRVQALEEHHDYVVSALDEIKQIIGSLGRQLNDIQDQLNDVQETCGSRIQEQDCRENYHMSDGGYCIPCPCNSHTTAEMSDGCVCDEGYQGPTGGPCQDIDECQENDSRGPCDDLCENYVGSYRCLCSIPGYAPNPQNKHVCIAERQCQNLTEAEAPENGGLVCHWYREQNSQQCTAMCNDGYEFPSRILAYEACGPRSGYIWTFKNDDPTATFRPPRCLEEFFPDFRTEADSAYFPGDCQSMNTTVQQQMKAQFVEVLNSNAVCSERSTRVCLVEDVDIRCGRRT